MLPRRVRSTTVVWMLEPAAGVTVTVPSEDTAVEYARLLTVMLVTPSTPMTFAEQLPKVCPVSDSVAVPGAVGLSVTVAVKPEEAQETPLVPVAEE